MNRDDQSELLQKAAKGALSPGEQAAFERLVETDRAFRDSWEEEKALQESLSALPNAPVASNFTSLVLQAVRKDEESAQREVQKLRFWPRFSWPARLALIGTACFALVLGGLRYQNHKRVEMAESLSAISEVATVLSTTEENASEAAALLQDFNAITHLSAVPVDQELDIELLVALQR